MAYAGKIVNTVRSGGRPEIIIKLFFYQKGIKNGI
jgi:hypothetical protein